MGRLLEGFGVGIISYSVSVYIAEIVPQNMRGGLGSVKQDFVSDSSTIYNILDIISVVGVLFMDVNSLQAALPNDQMSTSFIGGPTLPWFPQEPGSTYMSAGPHGNHSADSPKSNAIVSSSPKMMSLWERAIGSSKALLLDEIFLGPDALLKEEEEFEGSSQATVHSYPKGQNYSYAYKVTLREYYSASGRVTAQVLELLELEPDPQEHLRTGSSSQQHPLQLIEQLIENGLCKQLCVKYFPQLAVVARVVEPNSRKESVDMGSSTCMEWEVLERDHTAYTSLFQALKAFAVTDCIVDAVSASSMDMYPDESIANWEGGRKGEQMIFAKKFAGFIIFMLIICVLSACGLCDRIMICFSEEMLSKVHFFRKFKYSGHHSNENRDLEGTSVRDEHFGIQGRSSMHPPPDVETLDDLKTVE
ncbi:hypothetical protein RJ639_046004 [Escallonia herrerae]|uniref:Uncharacterized protein n=1 Tax=Escallonia herrerae TaxID=1293975 RepID=A0AA88W8V3_9ASTE|nr:hypothetical protein RJ639_046004 [Escallonia herrerae]